MGTKGASGLKEVFMGSNTYKVINEIDFCPIIAVPDEYDIKDSVETILLATGFEHRFESYEIKPLMKIATHFGSKLKIIHVESSTGMDSKQEASKKLLEKQLKSIPHDFLEVERDATINHTIQTIIEKDASIAMLVMINHDRTFFERLTRESVIKKISFNTKVPFLVIHLFE
jgi:nucleotide-binding universal stress UspA family protein